MTTTISKADLLHEIARNYVLKGLGEKNFDAIPYDENVTLRTPLCPGGSNNPLKGKENLRQQWWAPLPSLLGDVTFIDTFVNEDGTAVTAEFHCNIFLQALFCAPESNATIRLLFRLRRDSSSSVLTLANIS